MATVNLTEEQKEQLRRSYGHPYVINWEGINLTPKWIMTDEQFNRLTTLAREIAIENDLMLGTHTDKESFSLNFFEKDDEEEVMAADE